MKYTILIPPTFPQATVKEVLEDYFLIPRKIRHFLRTKNMSVSTGSPSIGKVGFQLVTFWN